MSALAATLPPPAHNERVVKLFVIAAVFWGVAAFAAGVLIALQLAFPVLNLDLGPSWRTWRARHP